jgi:putative transposase
VAFKNCFQHGFGYPKFKRRGENERFTSPRDTRIENNRIWLEKIGWTKFRGDTSQLKGKIKAATISLEAGKWYCSLRLEVSAEDYFDPRPFKEDAIGVDLGVVNPLTVTNGTQFKVLGKEERARLKQLETRRKRYQRQMARKQKGSENREKARLKVQRAFQKERFVRQDFQHKVSDRLTRNAETIIFEDLRVKDMTKKGGSSKRGLNREMLRIGFAGLVAKCTYKAHRRGGSVRKVTPKYTSQTCSDCGSIDKESRVSRDLFICTSCGHEQDADKNAALNILALA